MELGEKVAEFSGERKISFDGECYHSRWPLEIIKILKQYGVELNNVQWEGVWKKENELHIVLVFFERRESEESKTENDTDDYVVLKG